MPPADKGVHSVNEGDYKGFVVLKLHYSADEEKDEKWAAKVKREYASDDWDREFDLKPVGTKDSYPVFVDYRRAVHEDDRLAWQPSRGKIIYRGWDFGKQHPCVEFAQCYGVRKNYIDEIYEENMYLENFVQKVLAHSNIHFPGCVFVDWVDVSGRNEDAWGNSAMGTLRKYGLKPRGRDQTIEEGIQEMKKDMAMLDDGRPRLMVNPAKCQHLVAAFRGGYKRNPKGEIIKDGINDHPVDAARYLHSGIAKDTSKPWEDIKTKFRRQYKKFPAKGKTIWR